jgi:inner membrane protein involved in colicin E2 resistance
MIKRIVAIAFIFISTSVAWVILGGTLAIRTSEQQSASRQSVGELWGGEQVQTAPIVERRETQMQRVVRESGGLEQVESTETTAWVPIPVSGTEVRTRFRLDHRRKGLLWFATYAVDFAGRYAVRNASDEPVALRIRFSLPSGSRMLDDFRFRVNGVDLDLPVQDARVTRELSLEPGEEAEFDVGYRTQGVGTWRYELGESTTEVRDFRLAMTTDFQDVDFPAGTLSPTDKRRSAAGWDMEWTYARLLASADLGIEMPRKLNPGPWVSRVTFFAPVSLFLFFFALFVLTIVRGVRLHPMHYFFLAAGFFSFHLLLAYLVDHVSVGIAIIIASVVSVGLVTSYMHRVVDRRFAYVDVASAQLLYLVGFAYTFFLEGYTGLTVTVLSILTLFVVMQVTGRLDWEEIFGRSTAIPASPLERS